MQDEGKRGWGPHVVLLEQGDRQVLQDVMLDTCSVLCADPVLGGGPDKALGAVLILDTACVSSQVAVDIAQMHQHVTVVALQGTHRHLQYRAGLGWAGLGWTKVFCHEMQAS